jgi:hypothetical protein
MQQLRFILVVKKQRVAGMQQVFGWAFFENIPIKQSVAGSSVHGIVLAI